MKRNHLARGVVGLCACGIALSLVTGCVPYQTHKNLRSKLDQAELANRDLVRKINELQLQLKDQASRPGGGGVSNEEYARTLAELAKLREQVQQQQISVPFEKGDFDRVPGAEEEVGGGMRLGEALLFNPGEFHLKSAQLGTLDELASLIRTKYAGEVFLIEGHTDNVPLNKVKYLKDNWNLGYQRARAVYEYLLNRGIPKERMVLMTYGYGQPVDRTNQDTPEAQRLNRRVVVRRFGTRI